MLGNTKQGHRPDKSGAGRSSATVTVSSTRDSDVTFSGLQGAKPPSPESKGAGFVSARGQRNRSSGSGTRQYSGLRSLQATSPSRSSEKEGDRVRSTSAESEKLQMFSGMQKPSFGGRPRTSSKKSQSASPGLAASAESIKEQVQDTSDKLSAFGGAQKPSFGGRPRTKSKEPGYVPPSAGNQAVHEHDKLAEFVGVQKPSFGGRPRTNPAGSLSTSAQAAEVNHDSGSTSETEAGHRSLKSLAALTATSAEIPAELASADSVQSGIFTPRNDSEVLSARGRQRSNTMMQAFSEAEADAKAQALKSGASAAEAPEYCATPPVGIRKWEFDSQPPPIGSALEKKLTFGPDVVRTRKRTSSLSSFPPTADSDSQDKEGGGEEEEEAMDELADLGGNYFEQKTKLNITSWRHVEPTVQLEFPSMEGYLEKKRPTGASLETKRVVNPDNTCTHA